MRQQLAGVVLAGLWLWSSGCAPTPDKDPAPLPADIGQAPLPADLVAAWEKAGAVPGLISVNSWGFAFFHTGEIRTEAGKARDLPAFSWKAVVLDKLPMPARPFGLYLEGKHVTDAGLKELAGLEQLQTLILVRTKVTDAGLKELAGLKKLQTLSFLDTHVTDAGLKELATIQQLQSLSLTGTQVTDAGLKELAGFKQLHTLHLEGLQVTDAGLKELAGIKQLQTLHLYRTQVTYAAVAELQTQLPDCRIYR
jgi:hypothetical protein